MYFGTHKLHENINEPQLPRLRTAMYVRDNTTEPLINRHMGTDHFAKGCPLSETKCMATSLVESVLHV